VTPSSFDNSYNRPRLGRCGIKLHNTVLEPVYFMPYISKLATVIRLRTDANPSVWCIADGGASQRMTVEALQHQQQKCVWE